MFDKNYIENTGPYGVQAWLGYEMKSARQTGMKMEGRYACM